MRCSRVFREHREYAELSRVFENVANAFGSCGKRIWVMWQTHLGSRRGYEAVGPKKSDCLVFGAAVSGDPRHFLVFGAAVLIVRTFAKC